MENDNEVYNPESKTVDFSKMRATELPKVQRLIMPKPAPVNTEAVLVNIKEKIIEKGKEYKTKFYPIFGTSRCITSIVVQ